MTTKFSCWPFRFAAALLVAAAGSSPSLAADSPQLGTAKALYAQASYEDALVQLNSITDADATNQVDEYRALCLLALGRDSEAQKSLERIVVRAPLYAVKADEAPPKLVTLFERVRARTLPAAAKDLYARAKANFDGRHFTEAQAQFEEMLAVLKDTAADDPRSPVADLKQLGEGFLKLARAELTPAASAVPAPVVPRASTPKAPAIYNAQDADVIPPVDIVRDLPIWNPPDAFARRSFTGTLLIDIDEQGRVERSVLVDPIVSLYDSRLLLAARAWKFHPATRDGVAVKYRKAISVELRPSIK